MPKLGEIIGHMRLQTYIDGTPVYLAAWHTLKNTPNNNETFVEDLAVETAADLIRQLHDDHGVHPDDEPVKAGICEKFDLSMSVQRHGEEIASVKHVITLITGMPGETVLSLFQSMKYAIQRKLEIHYGIDAE